MAFFQDAPTLQNTYSADTKLSAHLKKLFSPDEFKKIDNHLKQCGELAVSDWLYWSKQAELEKPKHIPFDTWGRRIDHIEMSKGWLELEAQAAIHGIVAAGYEREYGDRSRVYQMALLYLFHSSSAFVSCPLAMTDGAARALELFGSAEQKERAFTRLTSRDPKKFWTSGQWMTERTGGSDVSGTSTIARRVTVGSGDDWQLHGVKWFTSATTSPMAMLLARPEGAEEGSRGLSLFYIELRDEQKRLKNIEILRLKDKLGTDALPTAEIELKGAPAQLVGEIGHGVKKISALFNITRIYNSVCAISHMRRALDWAQSYSQKRTAFGKKISEHVLHKQLLSELESEWQKCFQLTFYVAGLLGRDELGTATEAEKALLRGLTPIAKLYTAKKCIQVVSEVVEIFAGVGYCEDSGIPRMLRDAQVFSIWEGTTNILSLDFLRASQKDNALQFMIEKTNDQKLKEWAIKLQKDPLSVEKEARSLAFYVGDLFSQL